MNYTAQISSAIRAALDARGIEVTWADTNAAARAVEDVLETVFEDAWRYSELY